MKHGTALSTLAVNMLRTDRDWEATPIDAVLYLAIIGRGDDIKSRIAERHGFSTEDMETIQRIHDGLRTGEEWPVQAFTSQKASDIKIEVGCWPSGAKESP